MTHSEVTAIELRDDGSLALIVEVFGFEAGIPVEVSGSITQANGAMATFQDIQVLPPASPDGGSFLTVTTLPTTEFAAGEVITVVGRAAKIWGTVLQAGLPDLTSGVKAVWKAQLQTQ
jgi:hypothetical protein